MAFFRHFVNCKASIHVIYYFQESQQSQSVVEPPPKEVVMPLYMSERVINEKDILIVSKVSALHVTLYSYYLVIYRIVLKTAFRRYLLK